MDNYGRKVRIEQRRAESVLETADEDRLIDERIQRPAKPAPFRGESRPTRGGRTGDNQCLKIRSMCVRASQGRRQHIGGRTVAFFLRAPIAGALSKRSVE